MSKQRNYYEILNSTSNATFDELKRNYKQLILQCHPDKLQQDKLEAATVTSAAAVVGDPNLVPSTLDDSEFISINEAWNTLKDPVKRKHYDAELLLTKFQAHSNIFEHVTLADMEEHCHHDDDDRNFVSDQKQNQDTTETFYAYNCRCGGQYIIDESAATDNGIYKSQSASGQKNTKNNDCTNACQDCVTDDDDEDVGDKNKAAADRSDCEVMVECSECSLVIILSNAKQQQQSSTSS